MVSSENCGCSSSGYSVVIMQSLLHLVFCIYKKLQDMAQNIIITLEKELKVLTVLSDHIIII